jgi:hypothetical protein
MRDLMNNIDVKVAISPLATALADNTPSVSTILDLLGCNSATLVIAAGNLVDADATFAVTMDEGNVANLSDAAPVAASQLVGSLALASFTFNEDNKCRKIGYAGSKRYIRATITPSNNTGAAPLSALWVRAALGTMPATNPPL